MKRQFAAVCVLFLAASVSHAGVISLVDCSMDTLLGSGYSAVGSAAVADMKNDGVTYGKVTNQAYVNSAGDLWAYLYQVENTGETNILMFTLWPFGGADDNTQMGWLNDTTGVDAAFTIGVQSPDADGAISSGSSGPVVAFKYFDTLGITSDEKSSVMYVLSDQSPSTLNANVISGTVGTGVVVGVNANAVPEPTTVLYLVLGGLCLLGFYRRR